MSPKQKGDLIQLMKEHDTSKIILAIGDGANDVSMIT
jgi:P-type E1-E2 ATPase